MAMVERLVTHRRDPRRRAVAYLLLPAALVGAAVSCGGEKSGAGGSGGSAGGGVSSWGPGLEVDLPPDIEAKVKPLVDDITRYVCERSRNCCAKYDLEPRVDCESYATYLLLAGVDARTVGDIGNYDYRFNDALAKVCLDEIEKLVNDCIVDDSTQTAWWMACTGVVLVNSKGERPLECIFSQACALDPAQGEVCLDDHCVPEVEVPTGASCFGEANPTSFPTCRATDYCNSGDGTCHARAQLGEACGGACVDPYGCKDGNCAPRDPDGTPCLSDDSCLAGAYCICGDGGCTGKICVSPHKAGEACTFELQCGGGMHCTNGICKPEVLGICELPPKTTASAR
jgi:hypothetical protein